jgi:hypothetical protein
MRDRFGLRHHRMKSHLISQNRRLDLSEFCVSRVAFGVE